MKPPVYKVGTMLDIARIPLEALPRFLAELPEMLGMLREIDKFNHGLVEEASDRQHAEEVIAESEEQLLSGLEWVDDGKDDFKFTMTGKDEDGNEVLRMHADSKTRDFAAYHNGEDRTYDILLVGRLRRAGMTISDEDFAGMMPEGRFVLPAGRLHEIKDMTPEALNELCLSANRTLQVEGPKSEVPSAWQAVAQIIAP